MLAEVQVYPWRLWSLGVALGRMHARIHSLAVPAALLDVVPAWDLRHEDMAAPALLHMDYHPLNVMVDGGQVTGVLDWANVRVATAARTSPAR